MRLLFFLLFSLNALCSSSQVNNKMAGSSTVNIFIAGCDSIFYCTEAKLTPSILNGSKSDDTAFISTILSVSEGKTVIIKPFGGACGGAGETIRNLTADLKKRRIEFSVSEPDSAEQAYFNDISLQEAIRQINMSFSSDKRSQVNETGSFQFVLRRGGALLINFLMKNTITKGIFMTSFNKADVMQAIKRIEQDNNVTIMEGNVIIKGEEDVPYADFKIVKEVLKERGIYRFKVETTAKNQQNKPAVEPTPYVQRPTDLVIILTEKDILYYYHGNNCNKATSAQLSEINVVLKKEAVDKQPGELMILIKSMPGASFKSIIDLLDEIVLAGIPPKHYAEYDITENEINCIEKLTTNK